MTKREILQKAIEGQNQTTENRHNSYLISKQRAKELENELAKLGPKHGDVVECGRMKRIILKIDGEFVAKDIRGVFQSHGDCVQRLYKSHFVHYKVLYNVFD